MIGNSARSSHGVLLGFGEEVTWGTGVTATNFMEFRSQNFKMEIENERIESLGSNRSFTRQVRKNKSITGTLVFDLHPVDGIKLIKHALMGTVTSALASTATAYNHTFTAGDLSTITQQGLTFEIKPSNDTTTAFIFSGIRINTLKITGAINTVLQCEINFIGKDLTTGAFATTTASYAPNTPYVFHHANVDVDAGTESIIGFEFEINNNLKAEDDSRSLGSQLLSTLPPGRRDVSVSMTQRFDTLTAYNRFINNSFGAINFVFNNGETIGSDSPGTTDTMIINIPKAHFNTGGQPEISEVGILKQDLDFGITGDTTTSNPTDINITVTNSVTSYA